MKNQVNRPVKFAGIWWALNVFGNCFNPAVCVTTSLDARARAARAVLTLRWNWLETRVYWRGGLRFDWNSEHLAMRFGTFSETDFGGVWTWHFLGRQHVAL